MSASLIMTYPLFQIYLCYSTYHSESYASYLLDDFFMAHLPQGRKKKKKLCEINNFVCLPDFYTLNL